MGLQNAGEVSIEHDGKEYTVFNIVQKGIVTLVTGHKTKYGQIESLPPEALARVILTEMNKGGED
jgi:hypothetical protein